MQYNNLAQGMRCEELKDVLRSARVRLRTWEDHVTRLNEKIDFVNRQLDNLRAQANRTGDHEGFAPDIRDADDEIKNLERQLIDAEKKVRNERENVDQ